MHEVTITGLTRITRAKPNANGHTILAFFDCKTGGFALHGCAFVKTARGGFVVWPPRLVGPEGPRRHVGIADSHLHEAMLRQAKEAYRALGGESESLALSR